MARTTEHIAQMVSGGGAAAPAHFAHLESSGGVHQQTAAVLFEEHATSIYNYVCRVVGDRSEAEDITQEVFLKAHRHLTERGSLELPRPWLYKVASNACYDHLRRRKDTPAERRDEAAPDRDDGFVRSEMAALVDGALRRLEPRQKQALILRDWRGLPHEEIAYALGISVGASQALVSRSRESFQKEFTRLALGGDQAGSATTEAMGMGALLGLAPLLALPTGLLAASHVFGVTAAAASAGSAAHAASGGLLAKTLGGVTAKLVATSALVLAVSVGGGTLLVGHHAFRHSRQAPPVAVAALGASASATGEASTTAVFSGSSRQPAGGSPRDGGQTASGDTAPGGNHDGNGQSDAALGEQYDGGGAASADGDEQGSAPDSTDSAGTDSGDAADSAGADSSGDPAGTGDSDPADSAPTDPSAVDPDASGD